MNATTETSLEAKDAIRPQVLSLREQVYNAIVASPSGLTDQQIQEATGIGESTERPRRIELLNAGRIRLQTVINERPSPDNDLVLNVAYGRTRSGRKAVVWVAC